MVGLFVKTGLMSNLPPDTVLLQNKTVGPGDYVCVAATQSVVTAGAGTYFVVEHGGGAELVAGKSIVMLPGTHFHAGSQVHAWIAPGGPFCEDILKTLVSSEDEGILDIVTDIDYTSDSVKHQFFHVYPNPTPDRFTVEMVSIDPWQDVFVEVYGIRGERVLRKELPADLHRHELSLDGQVPGIFIVRVISDKHAGVERIIKR